jgi:translocation and assembly module TamA
MQRMLLAILTSFFTTTLFAQISVNIEISGIEKSMEDNVRLFLSIEQQKKYQLLNEGLLRRLHKKAPQEIAKALQPFGYYRPVIESQIKKNPTEQDPNQWLASYTIDPGPPLLVAEFNFILSNDISNDPEFKKLVKNVPFHEGSTFSHIEYDEFKTSLARAASELGYFNARFSEHRVEINLDTYQVSIYLNYEGGARYFFGKVTLNQDILHADLLQRYIPFEKGEAYSLNQLIELQQALNDSYYFQTVEVSPGEPLHDSNEIPITVKLTPRKRHRFSFGLGYGTDTGARAKFGWEMPRFNKNGHRIETDANVSQIGYSVVTNYRVPIYNPRTDQLIYTAGIINETVEDTESTLRTIGVTLKHSRDEWRESISLNYQQEDFVVADDSGVSILLIPGINWSRTWGNNFIDALDGLRFDIDLRGASEEIVSDTSFSQLSSKLKFITSISKRNRIITRGTLGGTWTDAFQELPTSVRFFAGGAQSVRGYSYRSLGPVDEDGKVVGGKYLLVGSIEFEHNFTNKWGMAIFYDVGNAINNLNDELAIGAGFGFRWKSPVGPIRLDLASALSLDGNPWRIHVTIGPDL